jgi:5-methylcytosine-specific restriction protein A
MSRSEVLAAQHDVIAALSRLRALLASADGQTRIDGLNFDQLMGRQLRYDSVGKIARLDREGEFTARGVRAVSAVADLLRIHPRDARKLVALGSAVFPTTLDGQSVEPKLPATAAALATGQIDTAHAEVIEHALSTEAAGRIDPPRWAAAEAQLAEWARLCRPDELARMAAELIDQLDEDGPGPNADDRQVNELRLSTSRDGVGGRIKGRLDSVTFETLSRAIEATVTSDNDEHKTLGERQADALGEICENALDEGRLPIKGGQRPHVQLTLDYHQLLRLAKSATLELGGRAGPGELRRLLCDARIVPVVLGGNSEPLDVGRARRTCTGSQRDALTARDRGCAYGGCHAPPHRCQVHHVTHWIDGGRTAVDVMIMLCVTHHRMIHRAGWTVRMVDGWPEFIPPKWLDISQTPRRKPRPHQYTHAS